MIFKMYAVYDEKAGAFLPPFVVPTEGMAVRTIGDCINSDTHQFGKHPEDYGLFYLGEYDDGQGIVAPVTPEIVRTGLQLVDRSGRASASEFGAGKRNGSSYEQEADARRIAEETAGGE